MSYLTEFSLPSIFRGGGNKKLNCLPIDLSTIPKGFRLLCANTHISNIIIPNLISGFMMGTVSGVLAGSLAPILPIMLASTLVMSLPALSSQADARDFCTVDKNDDRYDFYPDLQNIKILAINDGEVVKVNEFIRDNDPHNRQTLEAGGNSIVIKHDGFYSLYAHLSFGSIKVKKGDKVKKGQYIALMGSTGNSTCQHLHFETTFTNPHNAIGVFKPLIGFEPYKAFHIPNDTQPEDLKEYLHKYINHPAKIDKSGYLGPFCYIDK